MAQGYKDFTAGAILAAADLEDYTQNQSIMRFASAAARDTALSVVKTEGMLAYLIDVNTVTVYNGSAWSTIGSVHGALTAWTPAIVQSGGVSCTVTYAVYSRLGRTIFYTLILSVTGTGTANNVVTVSLPVTAASSSQHTSIGHGYIYDNSANLPVIHDAVIATTTTMKFVGAGTGSFLHQGQTGSTFAAALASSDIISASGWYEAAADA